MWDFGSAAVHHRLYCDWLEPDNCRAGMLGMRGTVPPAAGLMRSHAEEIACACCAKPASPRCRSASMSRRRRCSSSCRRPASKVVDGQQVMLDAREIKNVDEIMLLNQAAAMVDGVYHMIYEELKPGVRENDIVAAGQQDALRDGLRRRRGDQRDLRRALQSASAQLHRPHHPAGRPGLLRHPAILPGLPHLLLPHLQRRPRDDRPSATPTSSCREWLDAAIELIRPGVATDTVAQVWPKAEEFGFPSELAAFGLQFGHGLGLALHERPIISRLVIAGQSDGDQDRAWCSRSRPIARPTDGYSAARIEEEVVVTDKGCRVITLFPAEELPIANAY